MHRCAAKCGALACAGRAHATLRGIAAPTDQGPSSADTLRPGDHIRYEYSSPHVVLRGQRLVDGDSEGQRVHRLPRHALCQRPHLQRSDRTVTHGGHAPEPAASPRMRAGSRASEQATTATQACLVMRCQQEKPGQVLRVHACLGVVDVLRVAVLHPEMPPQGAAVRAIVPHKLRRDLQLDPQHRPAPVVSTKCLSKDCAAAESSEASQEYLDGLRSLPAALLQRSPGDGMQLSLQADAGESVHQRANGVAGRRVAQQRPDLLLPLRNVGVRALQYRTDNGN